MTTTSRRAAKVTTHAGAGDTTEKTGIERTECRRVSEVETKILRAVNVTMAVTVRKSTTATVSAITRKPAIEKSHPLQKAEGRVHPIDIRSARREAMKSAVEIITIEEILGRSVPLKARRRKRKNEVLAATKVVKDAKLKSAKRVERTKIASKTSLVTKVATKRESKRDIRALKMKIKSI